MFEPTSESISTPPSTSSTTPFRGSQSGRQASKPPAFQPTPKRPPFGIPYPRSFKVSETGLNAGTYLLYLPGAVSFEADEPGILPFARLVNAEIKAWDTDGVYVCLPIRDLATINDELNLVFRYADANDVSVQFLCRATKKVIHDQARAAVRRPHYPK